MQVAEREETTLVGSATNSETMTDKTTRGYTKNLSTVIYPSNDIVILDNVRLNSDEYRVVMKGDEVKLIFAYDEDGEPSIEIKGEQLRLLSSAYYWKISESKDEPSQGAIDLEYYGFVN